MSDQPLSEEAMLQSLRDMRLPAEAAGGVLAEVAVVVGVAALAALCLVGLLRLVSERRARPRPAPAEAPLAAILELPEGERRVALLHYLRDHAPQRFAALRGELYRPDGALDLAALEAEAGRSV